jgi:hypothetical protein
MIVSSCIVLEYNMNYQNLPFCPDFFNEGVNNERQFLKFVFVCANAGDISKTRSRNTGRFLLKELLWCIYHLNCMVLD